MFDVGFLEVLTIGTVALLVIGPERLPGAARYAGRLVGRGRRMLNDVKRDIDRELQLDEMQRSLQQSETLTELKQDVQQIDQTLQDLNRPVEHSILPPDPTPPPQSSDHDQRR